MKATIAECCSKLYFRIEHIKSLLILLNVLTSFALSDAHQINSEDRIFKNDFYVPDFPLNTPITRLHCQDTDWKCQRALYYIPLMTLSILRRMQKERREFARKEMVLHMARWQKRMPGKDGGKLLTGMYSNCTGKGPNV